IPGSSYWVPPPRSTACSYGIAQLVEKLANPLTTIESRRWRRKSRGGTLLPARKPSAEEDRRSLSRHRIIIVDGIVGIMTKHLNLRMT
ncbi:hypothetical protein LINGRAHAP2_LOCUS19747, partial [Linum grandiflorum]